MRFTEIDLFGVYVAPMSVLMVVAWVVTVALRRVASGFATSGIPPCSFSPST
jgi:protein AaeX